jgi:cytochrome c oxidase subunit 2
MKVWIAILMVLMLSACASEESADSLPTGDATQGERLFTQSIKGAPSCSTCHTVDGTDSVGPSLQGYGETASTREDDQSAEDYTYASIVRPAAHIVNGFSNVMYGQYGQRLSEQQIADLMAYLLTQ